MLMELPEVVDTGHLGPGGRYHLKRRRGVVLEKIRTLCKPMYLRNGNVQDCEGYGVTTASPTPVRLSMNLNALRHPG